MNERINISNYEAYYLDYLEGNLDNSLVNDLLLFLDENPELAIDSDLLELKAPVIEYSPIDKFALKDEAEKEVINDENFEAMCIANVEGLLSEKHQSDLAIICRGDKEKQKLFHSYQQLKIEPDYSLVYEKKSKLKRFEMGYVLSRYIPMGVAAAALFLMWFFNFDDSFQYRPQNLNLSSYEVNEFEPLEPFVVNQKTLKNNINETTIKPTFEVHQLAIKKVQLIPVKLDDTKPIRSKELFKDKTILNEKNVEAEAEEIENNTFYAFNKRVEMRFQETKTLEAIRLAGMDIETKKKIKYPKINGKNKKFFLKIGKLEIERK